MSAPFGHGLVQAPAVDPRLQLPEKIRQQTAPRNRAPEDLAQRNRPAFHHGRIIVGVDAHADVDETHLVSFGLHLRQQAADLAPIDENVVGPFDPGIHAVAPAQDPGQDRRSGEVDPEAKLGRQRRAQHNGKIDPAGR